MATYSLAPGQNMVGQIQYDETQQKDTLLDVARRFDVGYTQLVAANPKVDPWLPGQGTRIVLPTAYLLPDVPRRGIVINLTEQRLYYFRPDNTVETFPIGVGVQGWITPVGTTRVVAKRANPIWYPPKSILKERPELPKMVPPGPDNPLGAYALYLGWPAYLIHGTNKPDGVGRNVSHGCIHLYPEDEQLLFEQVPIGTPVRVINEEAEVGWVNGELYLATFPNKAQAEELDVTGHFDPAPIPNLIGKIAQAAGDQTDRIDWDKVQRAMFQRSGIPLQITQATPGSF